MLQLQNQVIELSPLVLDLRLPLPLLLQDDNQADRDEMTRDETRRDEMKLDEKRRLEMRQDEMM